MSNKTIKYTLNAQLMDNTVTPGDKNDKILGLVTAGSADKQRVISEIMEMNPGLERETVEAVVNLEQRAIQKLVLTGFRVNMGLYSAVAQFTGVVEGMAFDPARNSVYVSFTQGKDLREAIGAVGVNIVGEKGSSMYVSTGGAATRVPSDGSAAFVATAGRNFTLKGSKIKIAGDDPSVGITFVAEDGTETKLADDMIAINEPSRLVFLVPDTLADGTYTLRVTTQYTSSSANLLKSPRSIEQTIYIGEDPAGGDDGDDDGGGSLPLG